MIEMGKVILDELLELILTIYFLYWILQGELSKKWWKYVVSFLGLITTIVLLFFMNKEGYMALVIFGMDFVIIMWCCNNVFLKKIKFFIVSVVVNCLIQELIISIIYLFSNIRLNDLWYDRNLTIVVRIFNFCLLIIASGIINKMRMKYKGLDKRIPWLYSIVFCIAVFCCDLMIIQVELGIIENANKVGNKLTLIGIVIVGVLFVIGAVALPIIDGIKNHYRKENELKDRYLKMQENYYKKLYENENKVKGLRHDMSAHINCIKTLVDNEKYKELKEYTGQLDVETKHITEGSINCGNHIVNAVLNEQVSVAKEYNTNMVFEGLIPKTIKINSFDLCTLFYNLISNAEEACRDYNGNLKKEIVVKITSYKRNLKIEVVNPIMERVDIKMIGKQTKKKDKEWHGFGIRNVRDVVEKYEGKIEFKDMSDRFLVELLFVEIF